MMQKAIDPATGELVGEYPRLQESEIEEKLEQAEACWSAWRRTGFEHRAALLRAAADVLEAEKDALAERITREMGKVRREAVAEVEKCAWVCRYYADHAARFLRDEPVETDASRSFVTYRPLGPVLAVMPWNFPFWQVFRFAAPALMAGNVGLLKHASNVPGCGEAIEAVFRRAGFPEGAFTHLLIGSAQVKDIIADQRVRAVTLTGSEAAGSAVAAEAGRRIKKAVLELGGSDPYLILPDADLELAAETCVSSRLLNAGQSCIGAKRFIVTEAVYHSFYSLFLEKMRSAVAGDPNDPSSTIGPLARPDLREELHQQVRRSLDQGARLDLGGQIPPGRGAYYPPTVLSEVRPGMAAFDEELFGPVAAVVRVADEEEAIRMANRSSFGLGAAVFTRDGEKGERIAAEELEAGNCFVNGLVKSDPRLPFGGVKMSGFGRELARQGLLEFVNVKTVWIR